MAIAKKYLTAVSMLVCFQMVSCKTKDKNSTGEKIDTPVILRKDTTTARKSQHIKSAPIINISDTIAPKQNIIYIKDSASTSMRLSQKLALIYGQRLEAVVKQNKLTVTGAPIAWYKTQRAPFFFQAGLPVDKMPSKMPKAVLFKTIGGDSALIAHFYGPYEQTNVAYDALNEWLRDRKKNLKSPSYEVYVSDPIDKEGNPVDPYKVQTDIIFPYN